MLKVTGIGNKNSRDYQQFSQFIDPIFASLDSKVHWTDDHNMLVKAIEEVGDRSKTDLGAIIAGDGGLVYVLTNYFKTFGDEDPVFLWYMPCGTNNKEARDLEIISQLGFFQRFDTQRKRFAMNVADKIRQGKKLKKGKRDILRITSYDSTGKKLVNYAFDFCTGAPAEAVLDYYGRTKDQVTNDAMQNTKMEYNRFMIASTILISVGQLLTGQEVYERIHVNIKVDGEDIAHGVKKRSSGAFMSTGETVLPGFKTCYLANNNNGRAYFIESEMNELEMFRHLPNWIFGYHTPGEKEVKTAEFEFDKEEVIHFAGEFRKAVYAKVEVLPERVHFVVPNLRERIYVENLLHPMAGAVAKKFYIPFHDTFFSVAGNVAELVK